MYVMYSANTQVEKYQYKEETKSELKMQYGMELNGADEGIHYYTSCCCHCYSYHIFRYFIRYIFFAGRHKTANITQRKNKCEPNEKEKKINFDEDRKKKIENV